MGILNSAQRIVEAVSEQEDLIQQIQNALEGKAAGSEPSGTLNITENGIHDVKNYASVNVKVASGGGGGSVETCTVTVTNMSKFYSAWFYYMSDSTPVVSDVGTRSSAEFTVDKNSMAAIYSSQAQKSVSVSGGVTYLNPIDLLAEGIGFLKIDGDGTVETG